MTIYGKSGGIQKSKKNAIQLIEKRKETILRKSQTAI